MGEASADRVMDFRQTPFIVIWETTQVCDLACLHCRADAQPLSRPGELCCAYLPKGERHVGSV